MNSIRRRKLREIVAAAEDRYARREEPESPKEEPAPVIRPKGASGGGLDPTQTGRQRTHMSRGEIDRVLMRETTTLSEEEIRSFLPPRFK